MAKPNAKFIARAYVDSAKIEMKNHFIVLQSTTPGTCQISVNQPVEALQQITVDLGWGTMIDRVFTGYIERVIPGENGWYNLFCREYAAVLNNNFNIMLRHPTLQQVTDELSKQSGLKFEIPNQKYAQTAIPCFYADGSGYSILENIGRAFKINDYIWQQMANGTIFVGSYNDSFWYDKNITIPNNLLTGHQSGITATMPAAPMVKPNVTANNKRITKIEYMNTNMTISW